MLSRRNHPGRRATLRRMRRAAAGACLAGVAYAAHVAATAAEPDLRIEVTGSNLKRLDGETAAPVQVVTRADLERQGVLTAAEALARIAANLPFNSYAEAQALGDTSQPRLRRRVAARPRATHARSCCSTGAGSRTTPSTARAWTSTRFRSRRSSASRF